LMGQMRTTSYWGLLAETGIWPLECKIWYKKLMLYRLLMCSEEDRLAKRVLLEQRNMVEHNNWLKGVIEMARELKLNLDEAVAVTKEKWKKCVKAKIQQAIEQRFERMQEGGGKLRLIPYFGRKRYIVECESRVVQKIVKLRCRMSDIKENYKNKYREVGMVCRLCKRTEETLEHVFNECEKTREIMRPCVIDDVKKDSLVMLKMMVHRVDIVEKLISVQLPNVQDG